MEYVTNKLRVCHYPQIPCKPFIVRVNNEHDAKLISETLANQHLFLFRNNFIPDFSNGIVVQMLEDDEWVDYYNEAEYADFDELCNLYPEL